MRDYRKIRRRVDISLDKQQVVAIFSGLFVSAVLIFCLGLLVGRQSSAPEEARLQNPPAEELISEQAMETEDFAEAPVAKEAKESPLMVGLSQQEDNSAKDKKPLDPRKSKTKPEEGKRGKRSSDKPRAVSSKEPEEQSNTVSSLNGKRYTVQLKAFKDMEEAKRLSQDMKDKGVECFIEKAAKGNNELWYRVRTGNFGSELEARLYVTKLSSLGISKAWVAKIE